MVKFQCGDNFVATGLDETIKCVNDCGYSAHGQCRDVLRRYGTRSGRDFSCKQVIAQLSPTSVGELAQGAINSAKRTIFNKAKKAFKGLQKSMAKKNRKRRRYVNAWTKCGYCNLELPLTEEKHYLQCRAIQATPLPKTYQVIDNPNPSSAYLKRLNEMVRFHPS